MKPFDAIYFAFLTVLLNKLQVNNYDNTKKTDIHTFPERI
jgi:hypothetical protein